MNKRYKVAVITTIVAIVVSAGAFYLVSPLSISTQVNDPSPAGTGQSEPYQRFISMSEDEKMQAARQMSVEERWDNVLCC